jgi:DNA-binding winged helix-turn-helix (wHTH) protein
MAPGSYRFADFLLDPGDRKLLRDGAPVDLSSRYFDALVLLVRERGSLVSKDRFLDEVWRGIPVTDEALTQCVRTLRKALGDDASSPRFIETVPKHGYRFIAPLDEAPRRRAMTASPWTDTLLLAAAGTLGGGISGLVGGLFYGLAGASQPLQPGTGTVSILLVLMALTTLVALIGAAGVSVGIALATRFSSARSPWLLAGGAIGGFLVGGFAKLLGLDGFTLLLGRSPGDITGGPEGLILGAAVGLGAWVATGLSLRRGVAVAAGSGAAAGAAIVLMGGRLMGGSLDLLARQFPGSRLRLDQLGALAGESGFGPSSQLVTGTLEGALFAGCIVCAMTLARRTPSKEKGAGANPGASLSIEPQP